MFILFQTHNSEECVPVTPDTASQWNPLNSIWQSRLSIIQKWLSLFGVLTSGAIKDSFILLNSYVYILVFSLFLTKHVIIIFLNLMQTFIL